MNPLMYAYHWLALRLHYGFHMKHPAYPFRIFKNLARAKLNRLRGGKDFVLRGIDFAVTYTCNFNCDHCYARKLKAPERPVLTPDDYARICEQAMRLGCICFSLQGGEVFLRRDWEDVIRAFQPKYNHLLLTSNGSLVDEGRIVRLKELGLDTIYFSVDSGLPEEHDLFRRHEGSFAKIMRAVELCRRHKVKIVFNTCVTKDNLRSRGLKEVLDYSMRNRILVETIFARCLGNFDGRFEVMLDEADRTAYYELRKGYPYVVRDLDNNYGQWGCPAMKEVMYITAYGDVCPCPYTHISMGNVREEPLGEIRARALAESWWDHYHQECLTAFDEEFMRRYYPLIEKKPLVSLREFIEGRIEAEAGSRG